MTDSMLLDTLLLLGQQSNGGEDGLTEGLLVLGVVIALLAVSWFLGDRLAKFFHMPQYGLRLAIILGAIVFSAAMVSQGKLRFGVDLRGGMNYIGSLNFDTQDPQAGEVTAQDIIPNLVRRIDPAGVNEIVIRALGDDKIEVIMPSVDEVEADETWDRLVRAGLLQFRIVADRSIAADETAMQVAREQTEAGSSSRYIEKDGKRIARWVDLAREDTEGPIEPGQIVPFKYTPGPQNLVRDSRTLQIINMGQVPLSSNVKRHGLEFAQYCANNELRNPQILMMEPESDRSNVEGKHLTGIRQDVDEYARTCVAFNLSPEGGRRMGYFTQLNVDRGLGIVLDGQLHSAANIQEPIYDRGRITGQFTQEEIRDLIISLKSGKLDVALNKNPISKQFIESALGEELKQKGIFAIGISLIIVLVFMMIYYRFAGIVATLALLLNLMLILSLVMAIKQPLTLTGLAGLVLTVGMSVDANVLIFERIREEVEKGSALRMAIRNGFDKATVTIVDANLTTLITALVLYIIGSEQIKGFAVTLILGILMSMFTAIYCSRAVFDIAERRRYLTSFSIMKLLSKPKFDFLGKRYIAAALSLILIAVGIGSMFLLGPRILDHDLRGGSTARMVFNDPQDAEEIRNILQEENRTFGEQQERVEFTVSKLRDDNYPDRVFKVDSNLPVWDGEGESPYPELSELLTDVFGDKLARLRVDYDLQPASGSQSSLTVPPEFRVTSFRAARPSLSIQENEQEGAGGSETKSGGQTGSDEESESAGESGQDDQAAGEEAAAEAGGESSAQDEAESAEAPNQDPAVSAGPEVNEVSVRLEFRYPITGKSIRTLLSEAAFDQELLLEDEQIDVSSPDMTATDDPNTFSAQTWDVTMEIGSEEEARKILDGWSEDYNATPYFPTTSGVGGQIARETQWQALAAMIASLLGIIAYVWIRFQNVAFGLAAVIALIHDVLIVLGAIAISHFLAPSLGILGIDYFKISLPIIAALLTIIGYSLNDTIVVFDRIREVRGKRAEITAEMINTSILQTLSRTVLTSLTTFIVVFILYAFGGDAIHGFAFALVIGVIVGTYSSIFVASPALLWLMNTVGLNPGSAVEEPGSETT